MTFLFFIWLLQELFTVGSYDVSLNLRLNQRYTIVNIIVYFIHRLLLESYQEVGIKHGINHRYFCSESKLLNIV